MNKMLWNVAGAAGALTLLWVGSGFVGASWTALGMTALLALAYGVGVLELHRFRGVTVALGQQLQQLPQAQEGVSAWLESLPASVRAAVRQRLEGDRGALPGPALTPYLVGLLVMLGMLGTFLGMVVTFQGAVFALEGSTDLQAVRSALAAPIRGLGLSFGTSVAGVATSAALGWMSALCRRERLEVSRQLDSCLAGGLRSYSMVHQRQEAFAALQRQSQALPDVAERLHNLMEQMEQRSLRLDEQLQQRQDRFFQETSKAYGDLAQSVGQALRDSLTASGQAAAEGMRPVVESAMHRMVEQAQSSQAQWVAAVEHKLSGLASRLEVNSQTVTQVWEAALQEQAQRGDAVVTGLQASMERFAQRWDQQAQALQQSLGGAFSQAMADQAETQRQHQSVWREALESAGTRMQAQWQQSTESLQLQSQRGEAVVAGLEQALGQFTARWAEQSQALHQGLGHALEQVVSGQAQEQQQRQAAWIQALEAAGDKMHSNWQSLTERLESQSRQGASVVAGLEQALAQFTQRWEQQAQSLQQALSETLERSLAEQSSQQHRQQSAWSGALEQSSAQLQAHWQQTSTHWLAQQQQLGQVLQTAVADMHSQASEQATRTLSEIEQVLTRTEALVQVRAASEAQWTTERREGWEHLLSAWRSELDNFRQAEAQREAAVLARLDALHGAVAQHLSALGTALEAPMARLLQDTSQVPKAAAEVITQLRQEAAHFAEQNNQVLSERRALAQQLDSLFQSMGQSTQAQQMAMSSLVTSTSAMLERVHADFAGALEGQSGRLGDAVAGVAGSAIELSSLGEAFGQGVQLFQASNDRLIDTLQRIESSLTQSIQRSDEQLAYYVAQAREVIDLSVTSQQGILEDLRQLKTQPSVEASS